MVDIYKDRKYISFGADGINPLGIIRSLGQMGIKTDVIRDRVSSHLASIDKSRYVNKVFYSDSNEESLKILLDNYSSEELKPVLFFTYEGNCSILDENYDSLKDYFIFYNAGIQGGLGELNKKDVQLRLAEKCGIRVPKYEIVNKGDLPKHVPYPVFTKTLTSTESGWKSDMFICHDEKELIDAYKSIHASSIMLEEYIDAPYEFDLKGFSINGGEQIYLTYQKIWNFKDSKHRWMMYFEPCKNEEIKLQLINLIRSANYSGIFDAEFLQKENGELVFLEVNWRTGMYNYNHTSAGVNLPFLWAKSTIDGRIDYDAITPTIAKYSAMDEMTFNDVCHSPKLIFQWIKAIHNADFVFYYHKKDLVPCFFAWLHFFKRRFTNSVQKINAFVKKNDRG